MLYANVKLFLLQDVYALAKKLFNAIRVFLGLAYLFCYLVFIIARLLLFYLNLNTHTIMITGNFDQQLKKDILSLLKGSGYDPSSGITGSLEYHPFGGALGPYAYGDPAYRKNATRDATATLKAWLNEHRKNPYPTKGEKIMLAIITKMTLTQVSTWFANARRRLKKENKMTWTPRNRSEDEEEDDNIDLERNDEDEEPLKHPEETGSKETGA